MFGEIKQALHDFGVDFDVFFHENEVHDSGAVNRAIGRLREQGHMFEDDGALWLRTTDFGDDRDRVVIRSDGTPTYFAGDLAYYLHKRERGFDRSDHHARRRPPRVRRPDDGDVRRVRRHPRGQPRDPHRPDGQPRVGRGAAAHEQARRHHRHDGGPGGRGRRRRRVATRWCGPRPTRTSTWTSTCCASRRTRTRCSTSSTRTRARPASDATPATPACAPRTGSTRRCSTTRPSRRCSPRSGSTRASSPRRPSCGSRTGSPATSRPWRPLFHKWYDAKRRVVPQGDEEVTDAHRTRLWLTDATRQVLGNGLTMMGVGAPDRM